MWYAFMEFASTIGTDRQLNEADGIGAASWLAAALLIVWLWASGKSRNPAHGLCRSVCVVVSVVHPRVLRRLFVI